MEAIRLHMHVAFIGSDPKVEVDELVFKRGSERISMKFRKTECIVDALGNLHIVGKLPDKKTVEQLSENPYKIVREMKGISAVKFKTLRGRFQPQKICSVSIEFPSRKGEQICLAKNITLQRKT